MWSDAFIVWQPPEFVCSCCDIQNILDMRDPVLWHHHRIEHWHYCLFHLDYYPDCSNFHKEKQSLVPRDCNSLKDSYCKLLGMSANNWLLPNLVENSGVYIRLSINCHNLIADLDDTV